MLYGTAVTKDEEYVLSTVHYNRFPTMAKQLIIGSYHAITGLIIYTALTRTSVHL